MVHEPRNRHIQPAEWISTRDTLSKRRRLGGHCVRCGTVGLVHPGFFILFTKGGRLNARGIGQKFSYHFFHVRYDWIQLDWIRLDSIGFTASTNVAFAKFVSKIYSRNKSVAATNRSPDVAKSHVKKARMRSKDGAAILTQFLSTMNKI